MKKKDELPVRFKVIFVLSIMLFLAGIYGMHNDWTVWLILIPTWIIPGFLIEEFIGNSKTSQTLYICICLYLLVMNLALVLVHKDTAFIIGRIIHSVGVLLFAIAMIYDNNQELNDAKKKIEEMKQEKHQASIDEMRRMN